MISATINHPLLKKINELSLRCCGVSFRIVYPGEDNWEQAIPGDLALQPFCSMIKSTDEGRAGCRKNHVMMSIAACRGGITEHRCHAGALILVHPLPDGKESMIALVSSCIHSIGDQQADWEEARHEGKRLGLDTRKLKKAYNALPHLNDNGALAREFLKMAADIVQEIQLETYLETRLEEVLESRSDRRNLTRALVDRITAPTDVPTSRRKKSFAHNKMEKLVEITADLIRERPGMPYGVEEIAESLRVSPNHFSTAFRQFTGKCFTDFLNEQRIAYSQTLLENVMLNIEEVSLKSGYNDAGYFTRKFKKQTGMTPSQWRKTRVLTQ